MPQFQVLTERLKEGEEISVDEVLDPSIVGLAKDDEITVSSPVRVQGKMYRASDYVIVDASVSVPVTLPCAMCNEPFTRNIELKRWVHEEKIPKNGVLDLSEALREAILLEVPFFALCNGDSCHNVSEIQQFIRSERHQEGHTPFLSALE